MSGLSIKDLSKSFLEMAALWASGSPAIPSSSPSNPAAQLGRDVLGLMLAYGPTGLIPRSYDWNVGRPPPGSECLGLGLNLPAADGTSETRDHCTAGSGRDPDRQ